jgi:hypothetical protein
MLQFSAYERGYLGSSQADAMWRKVSDLLILMAVLKNHSYVSEKV